MVFTLTAGPGVARGRRRPSLTKTAPQPRAQITSPPPPKLRLIRARSPRLTCPRWRHGRLGRARAKYIFNMTISYSGVQSGGEGLIYQPSASLSIYSADGSPNPQGIVDVGQCVPMIARLTPGDPETGDYSLSYNTTDFTVTTDQNPPTASNTVQPGLRWFSNNTAQLYLWGDNPTATMNIGLDYQSPSDGEVAKAPAQVQAQTGTWHLVGDHRGGGARTNVIGDKGATVQQLADDIHLTASEFEAWLRPEEKGGKRPPSPTTPLTSQQTFSIPNTVVTFVPALPLFSLQSLLEMTAPMSAVKTCEENAIYSGLACQQQGWHNTFIVGWGGTTEAFEDSFSSNDVAAVFYGGHGGKDQHDGLTIYSLSCTDGEVSAASMGIGRNFNLRAICLYACYSANKKHWRKSRRKLDQFPSGPRHVCRCRGIL